MLDRDQQIRKSREQALWPLTKRRSTRCSRRRRISKPRSSNSTHACRRSAPSRPSARRTSTNRPCRTSKRLIAEVNKQLDVQEKLLDSEGKFVGLDSRRIQSDPGGTGQPDRPRSTPTSRRGRRKSRCRPRSRPRQSPRLMDRRAKFDAIAADWRRKPTRDGSPLGDPPAGGPKGVLSDEWRTARTRKAKLSNSPFATLHLGASDL